MTLANMRANGVHVVSAACEACGHKADVNVDAPPETVTVPKAGQRLRCSACGGKTISTRPAWHTAGRAGVPDDRRERSGVLKGDRQLTPLRDDNWRMAGAVSQCCAPAISRQAFGGHANASAVI